MELLATLKANPMLFYGVATFLGLLVGSFLNVVIYRFPIMLENYWETSAQDFLNEKHKQQKQGQTQSSDSQQAEPFNLVVPRSRCSNCETLISAWQNIPIISYLFLKGKCYHCKHPISCRYPIIEMVTGLLTLWCAISFGCTAQMLFASLFCWVLLSASMIDYDHHLLPDQFTLPLLWGGLLLSTQSVFVGPVEAILGATFGYLSLWAVYWTFKLITKKDGMGFGDFKLLAALGAWCGWQALPSIIILSSMVGAVLGVAMIAILKRDRSKPIPFGPYLATAGWLYFFFGETIDVQNWLF